MDKQDVAIALQQVEYKECKMLTRCILSIFIHWIYEPIGLIRFA